MKKIVGRLFSILVLLIVFILPSKVLAETQVPSEVEYWVTPKVVHINNDNELKYYLSLDYNSHTNQIVRASKERYRTTYGTDISIGDKSMSVEIIGHVFPDTVASYLPGWLASIIQNHTSIIDSGEASVDRDRWVWDSIAFILGNYNKNKEIIEIESFGEKPTSLEIVNSICRNCGLENDTGLNKKIMMEVVSDLQNNNVDPILLELFNIK